MPLMRTSRVARLERVDASEAFGPSTVTEGHLSSQGDRIVLRPNRGAAPRWDEGARVDAILHLRCGSLGRIAPDRC